ncbi:MAG: hypothetical protein NVSMB31_12860 [Vulcanimicrobiaceae bacterium]
MTRDFGRHAYGATLILLAALTLYWHDVTIWQLVGALGKWHREQVVYAAAFMAIAGGLAIQWRWTAQFGALVLGAIYFVFVLFWIPRIVHAPLVYNS